MTLAFTVQQMLMYLLHDLLEKFYKSMFLYISFAIR